MKRLILILLIAFPIFTYAEYNGVHAKFEIELKSGNQVIGYKYIDHGLNTLEYKQKLEADPKSFLFNEFTDEPGEYGCYRDRLEYFYNELILYKLVNPVEIRIDEIKNVKIIDLISASYAIQITGDYRANDQLWMRSKPIAKYSDFEEMCSYDTFIHTTNNISTEIKKKIEGIIKKATSKIKKKEVELNAQDVNKEFYEEEIQKINKERNSSILKLLKENKHLKTITVSMCTC